MKYIALPLIITLLRVVVVVSCVFFIPLFFAAATLEVLWDWNLKGYKDFKESITEEFYVQSEPVEVGEQFYVYRNIWDFIINKKTYRIKQ